MTWPNSQDRQLAENPGVGHYVREGDAENSWPQNVASVFELTAQLPVAAIEAADLPCASLVDVGTYPASASASQA